MSTYATWQSPFPSWLVSPIDVPERKTVITPMAMFRTYILPRRWKCDLTLTWTRTGSGIVGTETAVGTLVAEEFGTRGDDPTTETEIETTNWKGWSIGSDVFLDGAPPFPNPISAQWVFADGAVSTETDLNGFAVVMGDQFELTAWNEDRENTWNADEPELSVEAYVLMKGPDVWYQLVGSDSEPDDVGGSGHSYVIPIAWESGRPGTPFFGTISHSDSFTEGGIDYTVVMEGTVTPIEFWEFDGAIDADTGEPPVP